MKMRTFAVFVLFLAAGCSLAPDYQRPELPIGDKYEGSIPDGQAIANTAWWDLFKDPALHVLINAALKENRSLQVMAARVAEARALVGYVRADQYPFVDISGLAGRNDAGGALQGLGPVNDFGVFADLSFEVDLWGRLWNATEAQQRELLSAQHTQHSLLISLVAQTAQLYFNLIDLDMRAAIAERTIGNRRNATRLIRARFSQGIIPELDVNQAEIEEGDAMVSLAAIERERRLVLNALQTICGRSLGPVDRRATLADSFSVFELPAGVPAGLLERRPDVMAAEEAIRAEYARIGVAEAQRLPGLSILGSLGLRSQKSQDLFDVDSRSWSIGGQLLSPLIDWGKNKARVEAQKARAQQALKSYEDTVLRAVEEVEDAVASIETYRTEHEARKMQVKAASNAARLSRARYDDGVTPYLEVLDIERSLFDAELGASLTYQRYLSSLAQLYKALGGGWQQGSVQAG